MKALWERFGHLVRELGKFGVVGAFSYLIDLSIYTALYRSPLGWFWAKVASTVVAATVAFIGNRFWTWRDRERSGLRREYGLYFFFNAVGLGIALACLGVSHAVLGHYWPQVFHNQLADTIAAQGFGLVFGTLFRFWSYRRFVFVAASSDAGVEELTGEPVTRQ
ncbi:MAG: polysaccharide synthesis protein GtrA [Actinobacteria bacterium 13_1_20CM_3_71_11]|nr:MAG: polysaccharide synthesis protein GtrA [Actinobacteria bacterium 13_1_20CM_3_71_11]TML24524.1 MAG: GtrA family protein [Actinomycetota bacterium]